MASGSNPSAIEMVEKSIARSVFMLAFALALIVFLALVSTDSETVTTFPPSAESVTINVPYTTTVSPSSAPVAGSITLSAPVLGTQILPGQSYNISGSVAPVVSPLDEVTIQVSQAGSQTVLETGIVAVQPGGTFTFLATVGFSWPTGTYVVSATDAYGLSGSETFLVTYGDPWIG